MIDLSSSRPHMELFFKSFHLSPTATSITRLSDGLFFDVNEAFCRMTRYSRSELLGKTSLELGIWKTTEERNEFLEILTHEGRSHDFERAFYTKDKQARIGLLSATIIQIADDSAILMMIRDVTRTKENEKKIQRNEEDLRSLAYQLSMAEERERHAIGELLHDSIGQTLAMAKIKLSSLASRMNSKDAKSLDEVRQILEVTIRSIRSLSFELSPPVLYQVGFEAAIEWLVEKNEERTGIKTKCRTEGPQIVLDRAMAVLLFTVVRELLMNVMKHARAKNVTVSLFRSKEEIRIEVEDDGVGFDPSTLEATPARGYGLFSIQERMKHVGGSVQLSSHPGYGTKVITTAALKRKAD